MDTPASKLWLPLCVYLALTFGSGSTLPGESHEKMLLDNLLSPQDKPPYNKYARPLQNSSEPVAVDVTFTLLKVDSLDEKTQLLTTNIILTKFWNDYQLQWEPADFGGIRKVRIPVNRLWKPDLSIYNNADDSAGYINDDMLAIVSYNGDIMWAPQMKVTSYCPLKMKRFPYDSQICYIVFGSWVYDNSALKITTTKGARYAIREMASSEWNLHDIVVIPLNWKLDIMCCSETPGEFKFLAYKIEMDRKSMYHRLILFVPGVFLCFLTIFIFLLPPDSGEKVSLGVGIIISLTLLILVLDQFLPSDIDEVPLVAKFYGFTLAIVSLSLGLSTAVLNMHYRGSGRLPNCLRSCVQGPLGRLCCMPQDVYSRFTDEDDHSRLVFKTDEGMRPMEDIHTLEGGVQQPVASQSLELTLEEIRRYLKVCAMGGDSTTLKSSNEWRYLAILVDRIVFFLYIFISVIGTIAVLS